MASVWMSVIQQYKDYFAASLYPLLFLVCLLLIFFFPEARRERDSLVFSNLLIGAVIFCPPTAFLIMKMIGDLVYWRVFWMLTIPIVCGYAIVKLAAGFQKRVIRILVIVIAAAAIILSGSSVFTGENFSVRENNLKLPSQAIWVADSISENAAQEGIESPKAVVPEDLCSYIRQYDAGIRLAYGRNMAKGDVRQTKLYLEINSEEPKAKRLAHYARRAECDYIVLPSDCLLNGKLSDYSFVVVDEIAGYVIYLNEEKIQE